MPSMAKTVISAGPAHKLPTDLRKALLSDAEARAKWEDITPLARNEWICWVISVKKPETRRQHVERVRTQLKEGMRRPVAGPAAPTADTNGSGPESQLPCEVVVVSAYIDSRSF